MKLKPEIDRGASLLNWFKALWNGSKLYLENQVFFRTSAQ